MKQKVENECTHEYDKIFILVYSCQETVQDRRRLAMKSRNFFIPVYHNKRSGIRWAYFPYIS